LGFAVKILGEGGIPSADTRRWQSEPSLARSIEVLGPVFEYLDRIDVRVYRLSSQVIPYGTHPDLPAFAYARQLDAAAHELDALADRATALGLRLSTHPGQYTVLNAEDDAIVRKAMLDVEQDALLLDRLGQGPDGTIVIHVGGAYGDPLRARDRWARNWERLSERARRRVGLENDEHSFDLEDVLWLHERTGVRVVLDVHHHRVHPGSSSVDLGAAVAATTATWPPGTRPKVHLSSVRTTLQDALPDPPSARGRGTRRSASTSAIGYPKLANHADLVSPWDLEAVVRAAPCPVDVMLEAKAKDLAILWLRTILPRVLPDVFAAEERRSPARSPEQA
jgi:UV DNA damage endonuclease